MTPGPARLPSLSAALAGIPAGVQSTGPWSGRRQLFVKFAQEAETATIYTANALRDELVRLTNRSRYHSVAIVGRDALSEAEFLIQAFTPTCPIPVMLDHDGQRPAELEKIVQALSLVQVTLDGNEGATALERACTTVGMASRKQVAQGVAILPGVTASDGPLLRIVEQVHAASDDAQIVVHPTTDRSAELDRRWVIWLERAMALHADVRVLPRWPAAPAGTQGTGTHNARSD